ncbi:MAG TPA: hypothetical protein VI306_14385, partial [Pyrinomonadaceae bacterium]
SATPSELNSWCCLFPGLPKLNPGLWDETLSAFPPFMEVPRLPDYQHDPMLMIFFPTTHGR